jgi:AefR-like transcriptional repressor, C-terminal domain
MESARFPELGKRFYELGPKRGQTFLAGYFHEQIQRGHLVKDNPWTMVDLFVGRFWVCRQPHERRKNNRNILLRR